MNKRLSTVFAGSLAFLMMTTGAFACQGQAVLYEDDFSFADPAWGNYSDVKIDQGVLSLIPAESGSSTLQNQSGFLEGNVDICVDVVQNVADPSVSFAGLLFGGVDYNNYYLLQVSTNGYVNVVRLQKSKWLTPVPWTLTEGVVKAGAEPSQIRIVTAGNIVTGFVNGQQVVQFRAQLPADGMLIGFYGGGAGSQFDFDNLKITQASDAPPAAAPAPPPVAEPPAKPEPDPSPSPSPSRNLSRRPAENRSPVSPALRRYRAEPTAAFSPGRERAGRSGPRENRR